MISYIDEQVIIKSMLSVLGMWTTTCMEWRGNVISQFMQIKKEMKQKHLYSASSKQIRVNDLPVKVGQPRVSPTTFCLRVLTIISSCATPVNFQMQVSSNRITLHVDSTGLCYSFCHLFPNVWLVRCTALTRYDVEVVQRWQVECLPATACYLLNIHLPLTSQL